MPVSRDEGFSFDREPPEEVRKLIDELARLLNDELRASSRIQEVIARIEEAGFDATLSLAVLVGLIPHHALLDARPEASVTGFDREFLASLNLSFPRDGDEGG